MKHVIVGVVRKFDKAVQLLGLVRYVRYVRILHHLRYLKTKNTLLTNRLVEEGKALNHWKDIGSLKGNPGLESQQRDLSVTDITLCTQGQLQANRTKIKNDILALYKKDQGPNDAQWEMILTESPLVCVNAGAGSGKSTTLIYRIYVLVKYLKVPWSEISVFTFTNNSRFDLIDKLCDTFEKLGMPIDYKCAFNVVRTFHSYALLCHSKSTGLPYDSVFEIRYSGERKKKKNQLSVEDFALDRDDEEVLDYDKNDSEKVDAYLKTSYGNLYQKDESFQSLIKELYHYSISHIESDSALNKETDINLNFLFENDYSVTEYLYHYWNNIISSEHLELGIFSCPVKKGDSEKSFYYNARVKVTGEPILLAQPSMQKSKTDDLVNVGWHTKQKVEYLHANCDFDIQVIRKKYDYYRLDKMLSWESRKREGAIEAPAFDYTPQGEIPSKSESAKSHICNRMYTLINFVQNYGLDVEDCLSKINAQPLRKIDRVFVQATHCFYLNFIKELNNQEIYTFNQLFLKITPRKLELANNIPLSVRKKVKHLMIDEFQDTNALYAEFVKAIKYSLSEQSHAGSFMVVGDDFQSIYGWNASSPDYFSGFKEKFPSQDVDLKNITMEVNYRSVQNIIDFAELLLQEVPPGKMLEKSGIAYNGKSCINPVVYLTGWKDYDYQAIAQLAIKEAHITGATEEHPILILSRGNIAVDQLKKILWRHKNIEVMTFHSSKGLESSSTILIGNCQYNKENPIKNEVMRQYIGKSKYYHRVYDEMQTEEAYRLAYVAATRAKNHFYWVLSGEFYDKSFVELIKKNPNATIIESSDLELIDQR